MSTPAAQGINARGIHALLDALEAAPDIEPHSLMILRHGHLVAAGWWAPYTADRPHLVYSLSKSFTATAAGLAIAEGRLSLDDPVVSFFPEFEADITDPGSQAMRVRHIASMASGHLAETKDRALERDPAEPVRGFLLLPPDRAPGTVFAYNQPTTYTLAAILQRVTGQSLTAYLRPRLLDPLGIGDFAWLQHPAGRDLGYSGLHTTTDAISRLGQLYLQNGMWQGKRLLPEAWVTEATRVHTHNADGTAEGALSDWQQGYGFQFWRSRHGYRGDGAYGQFCLVLPEHDVVIATTAATNLMPLMLEQVWEHLLPAFHSSPLQGQEDQDEALQQRLTTLELPAVPGKPAPLTAHDLWSGARFGPSGGKCSAQPTLTTVAVAEDPAAAGGWTLTLHEGESRLDLRFSGSGWTVQAGRDAPVPTAVSAAWTDADTLSVRVRFLETPHHLAITCSLESGTFQARWPTVPLDQKLLRSLRAPLLTGG